MPETSQQLAAHQRAYTAALDRQQQADLAQRNTAFARSQIHAPLPLARPTLPPPSVALPVFEISAVLIGVLIAAEITRRRRPATATQRIGTYAAASSLLTPTEAEFYAVLREAVGPQAVIQCKVRLADLLTTRRGDYASFRRVSQKHVDFVLCTPGSLRPLVAVELDDPSHDRADRQARDAFVDQAYAQAGLPLVHMRTQREYSSAVLLTLLQPFLI